MIALELACLAIVLLFVVVRARLDDRPAAFLGRMGLLALASWIGEATCIHAYGFYTYSPRWSVFLDVVPLMIVLIWPVVLHSAWDLARAVRGGHNPNMPYVPALTAAIVLADASLIEPIAAAAGLWSWHEPGLLGVPPIGILGWSFFTFGTIALLERPLGRGLGARLGAQLVLANLFVHAALLVGWWGALRWVNHRVPPEPVVVLAWLFSAALTYRVIRRRTRLRIPRAWMLLRIPAAGFFFVLLALYARDQHALVGYALAFAPPYLASTDWRGRGSAPG